jgi:hypothetical protein
MGYFCPRAVNVLGLPGNTNPSSVDAPEAESFDLTIAPNPANEFVVLKSKAGLKTVQLFDITGKSVLTVQANNQNRVVIDRNNLPSGFYLINAEVGETTVIQKLILK